MIQPLSQSEVVAYLLNKNLIDPTDVCDSGLLVTDVSRRNCNVKVVVERGVSYLVKQCGEPNAIETLANEAVVYDMLYTDPRYRSLTDYLPRYYGYDSAKNLLILALLAGDAQDLEHYHARGHFSKTIGRAVARGLAELHKVTISEQLGRSPGRRAVSDLPWVFTIHRPSLSQLRDLSAASRQVVGILQRYPEFGDLIDACAGNWRASSLIHGDVKWANFMVFAPNGSGRKTRLKIVDWEYAGLGDPCWDVGGALSAYISCWVLSMPMISAATPIEWERLSRFPLEPMQPAMRAFWEAYARHMSLDSLQRDSLLWRSTLFCAVRLVQTAIERTQTVTVLSKNVVHLLQLAMNMLRRPVEAIVHVLGIDLKSDLVNA
ncbi:MAG TPA: aminoglycoside phosphotransferase family protein [Chloroflexota bacterium]|nr:aminoglycoside phosphotransferase family protein [Chloroflexota bacterium]